LVRALLPVLEPELALVQVQPLVLVQLQVLEPELVLELVRLQEQLQVLVQERLLVLQQQVLFWLQALPDEQPVRVSYLPELLLF
jgi:hypothetical protein